VNYWKVIVATVVIFGAGVFTGGLLVNYVHTSQVRSKHTEHPPVAVATTNAPVVPPGPTPRLPEVLSRPFLPKLDSLLQLSSDQHKAIEKIISDSQASMRKVMQDARVNIRATLTPDQRSRFDDLMKHPKKAAAALNTNSVETNLPAAATLSVPTNPPAATN
jgi:hypothetical protein